MSLRVETFTDVTLVPPPNALAAIVQFGLAEPENFPDFARHNRGDIPVDARIDDTNTPPAVLDGTYIWGGAALHHFGHFVGETLGRLWITEEPIYKGLPVLFLINPENPQIKPHLEAALAYLGIENYLIKSEPVIASKLVIAEAGKHLQQPSTDQYDQWLAAVPNYAELEDASFPADVCVLRGHVQAGKIAGEQALEKILENAGYFVLRPENHGFTDQLKYYRNAKRLICSEGSAMHMVDLLPTLNAKVAVLNRRPRSTLAETSMRRKATTLHILPAACRAITPRQGDTMRYNRALSYIPLNDLQTFLTQEGFIRADQWPANWDKNVLAEEAGPYCDPQGIVAAEDLNGLLAERLMEEVALHFKQIQLLQYKLAAIRAYADYHQGNYNEALTAAGALKAQYPSSTQMATLTANCERSIAQHGSLLGRLTERFAKIFRADSPRPPAIETPDELQ